MIEPEVVLIARDKEYTLGATPVVVPASEVVLIVRGAPAGLVRLDGKARYLKTTSGVLSIDLTRSTGYHRLSVGGSDFWFATEDSKARLEGVSAMLAELRGLGTNWAGQINFSEGGGLRDPHVVYAWLDHNADRVLACVKSILVAPHVDQRVERVVSRRGGAGLDLAATLRMARSDPARFLEEHPGGALRVGDKAFMPQRVVRRSRRSTIDTPANRRVVRLLMLVRDLADEVYLTIDERQFQSRCLAWRDACRALMGLGVAQGLARASVHVDVSGRSQVELVDRRYAYTHQTLRETLATFGWAPDATPQARYSYVQRADTIYQAYCAVLFSIALGLEQTDSVLGRRQPAFVGPDAELYFDAVPPTHVLESWRSQSKRPDTSRPDVVVYKPSTKEVAVVDAKYRVHGNAATEDSRKEVSAYMSLYGLDRIGIAYPGTGGSEVIAGLGREIREIPVGVPAPPPEELRLALDSLLGRQRF